MPMTLDQLRQNLERTLQLQWYDGAVYLLDEIERQYGLATQDRIFQELLQRLGPREMRHFLAALAKPLDRVYSQSTAAKLTLLSETTDTTNLK